MLTGRIYSAQEALDLGLVRRLVEPDQLLPEAIALGQEIAANPASTLRAVKEMTYQDLFAPNLEATEQNAQAMRCGEPLAAAHGADALRAAAAPEHREAVRAFSEKRTPRPSTTRSTCAAWPAGDAEPGLAARSPRRMCHALGLVGRRPSPELAARERVSRSQLREQ